MANGGDGGGREEGDDATAAAPNAHLPVPPSTLPPQDFQSDADANDMKYFGPRIVSNAYTIDQAMNGLENFNTEIS